MFTMKKSTEVSPPFSFDGDYGPIILSIFISIVGKYKYVYIDGRTKTTLKGKRYARYSLMKSETTRQSEPKKGCLEIIGFRSINDSTNYD